MDDNRTSFIASPYQHHLLNTMGKGELSKAYHLVSFDVQQLELAPQVLSQTCLRLVQQFEILRTLPAANKPEDGISGQCIMDVPTTFPVGEDIPEDCDAPFAVALRVRDNKSTLTIRLSVFCGDIYTLSDLMALLSHALIGAKPLPPAIHRTGAVESRR